MKIIYCSVFVALFQLPLASLCFENNVCKTFKDYYTIKNNPNCEYDIAADPDADPIAIIKYYGHPAETHKVTTIDGYILTMFRIPNNQASSKTNPVFLQHGLMGSATNFLGLRNNSLAFLLADAGYDVWLGNYRGTEYSEGHVNLTVFDEQYWDHSVDDIGLYDIPANLDYISKATGHKGKIIYIGHSLGTTVALMYSSTFPEKAEQTLKLMILLAPAAHLPNVQAPIFRYFRTLYKPMLKSIKDANAMRLVSRGKNLKMLAHQVCSNSPNSLRGCIRTLGSTFSGPQSQTEAKTVPVIFNTMPAGSSFKVVTHIADFCMGYFRRYDYGLDNLKIYGFSKPPNYNLNKIKVPVFLSYAINDWATTAKDSINLFNGLPDGIRHGIYEIKIPNFNHADFLFGKNAKSILYDVVLQVIEDTLANQ